MYPKCLVGKTKSLLCTVCPTKRRVDHRRPNSTRRPACLYQDIGQTGALGKLTYAPRKTARKTSITIRPQGKKYFPTFREHCFAVCGHTDFKSRALYTSRQSQMYIFHVLYIVVIKLLWDFFIHLTTSMGDA